MDNVTTGLKMLDDGVAFENGNEWLKLALPKKAVLRKPRGLKLDVKATKKNNGVGVYEVPKSDTYVYIKEKLADGSVIQCTRFKPIPRADREAMYAAGVAKGLEVKPLEAAKDEPDGGPAKLITMDELN